MATPGYFLPYVLPHVAGCPDVAARAEILRTMIRFCEETRVWKAIMPGMDVEAGVAEYAVPCPTDAALALVEQVWVDGVEIPPATVDAVAAGYENWITEEGTPLCYVQLAPDVLTLVPKPTVDAVESLVIRGCFKPSRSAATVPDFLFERYAETIGFGAAANLLNTPGRPWFDPKSAAACMVRYEAGLDRAIAEAGKSFGRAKNRVRGQFF